MKDLCVIDSLNLFLTLFDLILVEPKDFSKYTESHYWGVFGPHD
jgi:hypothetical protein